MTTTTQTKYNFENPLDYNPEIPNAKELLALWMKIHTLPQEFFSQAAIFKITKFEHGSR